MFESRKVVVIMPAYNAATALQRTHEEVLAQGVVDLVIVVDDASQDATAAIARTLPRAVVEIHPRNRDYGANQNTAYPGASPTRDHEGPNRPHGSRSGRRPGL